MEYVSALRELAVTCRFGKLHDELVRDQLIEKTIHLKVRERLLMESDDMSCDKALNLASQIEQALHESKKMEVRREFEENTDGLHNSLPTHSQTISAYIFPPEECRQRWSGYARPVSGHDATSAYRRDTMTLSAII